MIDDIHLEIARLYSKDPNFNQVKAAIDLGVCRTTLRKHLNRIRREKISTVAPTPARQCSPIKTVKLEDLVETERLDTKKILRAALAEIPDGELAYDETLSRDLRLSRDKWREAVRLPEFERFKATLPNRKVVWGNPRTIADLKEQDGVL